MTPETDTVLKLIQTGGITAIAGCLWLLYKFIWLPYLQVRDKDVIARNDENRLRRAEIKCLRCFIQHMKSEGYAIDLPDLTEDP